MLNINVVYLGTSEHVALRRGDVRIVWSGASLPDCDLYAYLGAYSFFGRRPGPQVLVQGNPSSRSLESSQGKSFNTSIMS